MMRNLVILLGALGLGGCAGQAEFSVPVPEEPVVAAVGEVSLARGASADLPLDLVVQVFDRGLGAAANSTVFPELRKAESILLPVSLAETLVASDAWGVVRVAESAEVIAPLRIRGRILRADGSELVLQVSARTVDGRVLLDRTYRDVASEADYAGRNGEDPFVDLYRAVSNDLLDAVSGMSPRERQTQQRLATMLFAARLAPDTFSIYLRQAADGRRVLEGYPANDDPMLKRVLRLRAQDDLFVDTVDQQYRDLSERVSESYDLWRQYSHELTLYGESYSESLSGRTRAGRRGSFAAMQQVYGSFRKVKLQEEDLHDLVAGFAGESLETVMDVDDRVVRLRGSVNERYAQWRRILSQIFALETGELEQP